MPDVPRWIGHVGLVVALPLRGTALAGQLWWAVLLTIPSFALVVLRAGLSEV